MDYKPYTPGTPLTTAPVQNPHSPAASGYKQQPVSMPGVLDQTRSLFTPVAFDASKDNK